LPAELIDGVAIARSIRSEIAREVEDLAKSGVQPGLAVILVGDDPASEVYVRAKGKACEEAGMRGVTIRLPASTREREILDRIAQLNEDDSIHGILVQMPLPRHVSSEAIVRAVDPSKDIDGFHPVNVGKLLAGDRDGFAPCTPAGIQVLLERCGVDPEGKECVIVGRSNIVGKPMAALLIQDAPGGNATVTICHRHTRDLAAQVRRGDIVIAAAGRPRLITGDMVKPGAVVIDVGVSRVNDPAARRGYRLVGDVDFESVRRVAGLLTPVPGGVGPMTIAMLLANTLKAAKRSPKSRRPHPAPAAT
jgi:methylenetetrahydrofolate dehydrogenase (NADP+) / methenyltetrahydrofolate cyclohydrolase